jgi:hypothetical protein
VPHALCCRDLACERQACGALLEGTLSPNLGTLPYLQTLDLGSNNLSGVLPPQWGLPGRFADLQILWVAALHACLLATCLLCFAFLLRPC